MDVKNLPCVILAGKALRLLGLGNELRRFIVGTRSVVRAPFVVALGSVEG